MDNQLTELDKLFTNGLDGLEAQPAERVWQGVEQHLDDKRYEAMRKKYNRLKYLLLLLLITFSATTFYLLRNKENTELAALPQKTIIDNAINYSTPAIVTSPNNPNPVSTQNINPSATANDNNLKASIDKPKNNAKPIRQIPGQLSALPQYAYKASPKPAIDRNKIAVQPAIKNEPKLSPAIENKEPDAADVANTTSKKALVSKGKVSATVSGGNVSEEEITNAQAEPEGEEKDNNAGTTLAKLKKPQVEKKEKDMQYRPAPDQDIAASFRFSVSPFIGYNFSKPRIRAGAKEYSSNDYLEIRSRENNGVASNAIMGALVNINLSNKWDLQTGAGFVKYNSTILPQKIYAKTDSSGSKGFVLNTSNGTVYLRSGLASPAIGTDTVQTSVTETKTSYVLVPLTAQYKMPVGNFIFGLQGGVYSNILKSQWLQTTISKNGTSEVKTADKIEGLRPIYFNAAIGGNIEYLLSNRLSVYASPQLLVPITSINKNTPARTTRAGANLLVGIKFRF